MHKRECKCLNGALSAFGAFAAAAGGPSDGGSFTDVLLAARVLWKQKAGPAPPDTEVAALAPGAVDGVARLAAFLVGEAALRRLLPPGTEAGEVTRLLGQFQANNFGVLDDLQVSAPLFNLPSRRDPLHTLHLFRPPLLSVIADNIQCALNHHHASPFEQVCLGAGVYPRGALLNHGCDPNCVLVYEGTVQVESLPPPGHSKK